MNTISTYFFTDETDKSVLGHVHAADRNLPGTFADRLAVFLNYAKILDRAHPDYATDAALIAAGSKILMPTQTNEEDDQHIALFVDERYIRYHNPATLDRFREGAKHFKPYGVEFLEISAELIAAANRLQPGVSRT